MSSFTGADSKSCDDCVGLRFLTKEGFVMLLLVVKDFDLYEFIL